MSRADRLPHARGAEQAILGAALLDGVDVVRRLRALDPDDFFLPENRAVWLAMLDLYEAGDPVDITMVIERLTRSAAKRARVDPAYVSSLIDGMPAAANVSAYAREVQRAAALRSVVRSCHYLADRASERDADAEAVVEEFQRDARHAAAALDLVGETAVVSMADVALVREAAAETGYQTGYSFIDCEPAARPDRGRMMTIIAAPSVGKTQFALEMIRGMIEQGHAARKHVFTLEMPPRKIVRRSMMAFASLAPDEVDRFANGRAAGRRTLDEYREAYRGVTMCQSRTPAKMRSVLRKILDESGALDLVVVDYLHKVYVETSGGGMYQNVSEAFDQIESMCRELDVPMVLLAHPKIEYTEKTPIHMNSTRDTPRPRDGSDVILGLWRPRHDEEVDPPRRRRTLRARFCKVKDGEETGADLIYDMWSQRIDERSSREEPDGEDKALWE